MSSYGSPILSRSEILTALAEAGIGGVTDADLRNPSADFIKDLYTRILFRLDLLNEEDRRQVDFAALEQFENPDLHIGAVQVMNLYVRMKTMMVKLLCPIGFTLKDLIRPDALPTQHFVGTLMNFALHKLSRMNLIEPIVDDSTVLDEQQREWEAKISQLNAEIAEINEARERELPLVQEIDAQVKELRQNMAGLNSEQMSLRATFRKLKEKAADMDKEISKAEFDLVQTVQENANLRSKIVQSPEKLQRALEEKKLVREELKNAERSAMQIFQEKAALLDIYAKAFKKMSKSAAQMQSINEQINNSKSIEKEFKGVKAKLTEDAMMDKTLEAKLVERQGKVEQLYESLKQLEKERDLIFEEAAKELDNVKLEVESKRHDLEERQKEVESVVAKVDANAAKTNQVKRSGTAKVQQLASKCEEIVKQFQEYKNSFGALLPNHSTESSIPLN